ncbi:MAG: sulfatase [Rhodothermales bacterium]|nr:sulfatase [Rhodothermales bacterium]
MLSRSFLFAFVIAVSLVGCEGPKDAPPNVVLIIIDDLGWMDTATYGSSFYETPNIDRLASEGARFTNFYAASPVCSPTRASIMTGKHPARLDLTNWIGGEQNGILNQAEYIRELPVEETTVGDAFSDLGYSTGYIGKWHLGRQGFLAGDNGFDFSFAVNEAGQPGSYFPPYENPNWPITNVPDLEGDPEGTYLTDRLSEAAVSFIKEPRDTPFLLVMSHYSVHTPLQAPDTLVEQYAEKAALLGPDSEANYRAEEWGETKLRQDHPTYAAMVESIDRSVGRVLSALEDSGMDEETIVVFTSDNGGLSTLRRRGFNQATSNLPLRAGKGWLYEGGIRIPLIMRHPGSISAGQTVDAPGMTTDLFPTLLELTGHSATPALHQDGVSLSDALGEASVVSPRPLFWHFPHYHGSGNRPGGAVRIGNMKLIEWMEDGAVEMYDLEADIGESVSLVEDRPDEAARLRDVLDVWRREVGANMPTRAN